MSGEDLSSEIGLSDCLSDWLLFEIQYLGNAEATVSEWVDQKSYQLPSISETRQNRSCGLFGDL